MKYEISDMINFANILRQLMALLLQSYQERRELCIQRQTQIQPAKSTKTLSIQTSLETIDRLSYTEIASGESASCVDPAACTNAVGIPTQSDSQSRVELLNNNIMVDVELISVASEVNPDL